MQGRIDYPIQRTFITRLCLLTVLVICSSVCHASGFSVPGGFSIAGLGTADTLVANPDEVGALPYNPAAMSFHENRNLMLGLTAVWPNSNVTPEGESKKISDDPDSPIFVPNLYFMSPVTDSLSLGVGINAPFGLETNWKSGTFPEFAGPLEPLEPSKSRLEMFNLNPNISYRINERASIAAGLDYFRVRDATSDTQGIGLSGDGDDLGWNAAFMYVLDRWSFGLSYMSAVDVELDGEFDATKVFGFKVDSKTELNFPDIFRLGVRYQATERLAVEFDFDRTGWSAFDEIVVKSADSVPTAGISSGDTLAVTTNNWDNANSYHFGATYMILPATQLRFGYTFNHNPQPEEYFSPRYPNARRHLFSAGIKQEYKAWELEGGLMYGRWEDRKVDNSDPFTGGDANGTSAYNGKYELDGILAGIGVNFNF